MVGIACERFLIPRDRIIFDGIVGRRTSTTHGIIREVCLQLVRTTLRTVHWVCVQGGTRTECEEQDADAGNTATHGYEESPGTGRNGYGSSRFPSFCMPGGREVEIVGSVTMGVSVLVLASSV